MTTISTARRFFETIRHLRPRQFHARIRRWIRSALYRNRIVGGTHVHTVHLKDSQSIWAPNSIQCEIGSCEQLNDLESLARNSFTFLGRKIEFEHDISWNSADSSRLWRFNLHYFDYLKSLAPQRIIGNSKTEFSLFRGLVLSWINGNRRLRGDGWHPYTISLRLVNWLNAAHLFRKQIVEDCRFESALNESLTFQVHFLASNLEYDVRGNHLIKNAKALIWAGISLEGAGVGRWLSSGLRILQEELDEQILADGGHFERSPGYHCQVLQDLLEVAVLMSRNDYVTPGWLESRIEKMAEFLSITLPSTGRLPLFKDTTLDSVPAAEDLVFAVDCYFGKSSSMGTAGEYSNLLFGDAVAKTLSTGLSEGKSVCFTDSGFGLLQTPDRRDHLILDFGRPCPDYLPAHAHADALTYELHIGGNPVCVDSGVYEYEAGPWRQYFRSTRAHNTVSVGGLDQSEVWGSFRVARRARCRLNRWEHLGDQVLVEAEHDGYRRLRPSVIHRRTVVWNRAQRWWLFVDQLLGTGSVTSVCSHVHLHPSFTVDAPSPEVTELVGPEPVWLSTFAGTEVEQVRGIESPEIQGWYSERFGELCPKTVLNLLPSSGKLPLVFGYLISADSPASASMEGSLLVLEKSGTHSAVVIGEPA